MGCEYQQLETNMVKQNKIKFKRTIKDIEVKQNKTKPKFKRTIKDIEASFTAFDEYKRRVRKKGGQVSHISTRCIDTISQALALGHHPEFASAGAGIKYTTLKHWLKKGKDDFDRLEVLELKGIPLRDEDYSLFFELYVRVQQALFESQDAPLKSISLAAKDGDWRAAAHFLERRFPKQWGKKLESRVENVGQPTTMRTLIVVPKRVETMEEWEDAVVAEDKGILQYTPQQALPGSSENEQPIAEQGFDELVGLN